MQKSDIKPRMEYAFREKHTPGTPLQHVRVIEHIRADRWKVEWIDPNPGLVHYVSSRQLVVPWKGRKAFLKEEENARRLQEYNENHGYTNPGSPVVRALEQIYESAGDAHVFWHGCLNCAPEALER